MKGQRKEKQERKWENGYIYIHTKRVSILPALPSFSFSLLSCCCLRRNDFTILCTSYMFIPYSLVDVHLERRSSFFPGNNFIEGLLSEHVEKEKQQVN